MRSNWKHIKTVIDSEPFVIDGMNIWDYKWSSTNDSIQIKDPLYGKAYSFNVYEISNKENKVKFAAGEFSNCIWGIYMQE